MTFAGSYAAGHGLVPRRRRDTSAARKRTGMITSAKVNQAVPDGDDSELFTYHRLRVPMRLREAAKLGLLGREFAFQIQGNATSFRLTGSLGNHVDCTH